MSDATQSGREMDARVAKLLGWRFAYTDCKVPEHEATACWIKPGDPDHKHSILPEFTRDIAAAFEVVERMRAKGYEFNFSSGDMWIVNCGNAAVVATSHNASLPAAICDVVLKALSALEGERK